MGIPQLKSGAEGKTGRAKTHEKVCEDVLTVVASRDELDAVDPAPWSPRCCPGCRLPCPASAPPSCNERTQGASPSSGPDEVVTTPTSRGGRWYQPTPSQTRSPQLPTPRDGGAHARARLRGRGQGADPGLLRLPLPLPRRHDHPLRQGHHGPVQRHPHVHLGRATPGRLRAAGRCHRPAGPGHKGQARRPAGDVHRGVPCSPTSTGGQARGAVDTPAMAGPGTAVTVGWSTPHAPVQTPTITAQWSRPKETACP